MQQDSKCKICRRAGVKLFIKGEKCVSPKCTLVKKSYPPGQKGKKRPSPLSEYGKELKEKQKLKNWYNLSERQFRNYFREILSKGGKVEDAGSFLIQRLESRFDNVIFRLGFAASHDQARQFITHGHFLINGKKVTIPSRQLKKGEKIILNPISKTKKLFENLAVKLKSHQPPVWLKLDIEKLEAEVIGQPTILEANPQADISIIFEYYAR